LPEAEEQKMKELRKTLVTDENSELVEKFRSEIKTILSNAGNQ
jgi:hypothetical protein